MQELFTTLRARNMVLVFVDEIDDFVRAAKAEGLLISGGAFFLNAANKVCAQYFYL